jgi:hypothetical protein
MRHRGAIPESAIDYFGVVSSATGNLMTDLDIFETGTVLLVPLNEWKALYEIANRLRQSEPWRNLTDTDLFALQDPATQQIGLVSVLGNLGEVFAVQLYLPPEGLQFWLQFFRKGTPNPILAQFKLRMLEVSFVPKKALTSPDLALGKQLALGTPKSRTNGYPQFRSYRPRCLPWYLEAEEVHLLRIALDASLEFAARRNRGEEPWLIDDSTGDELPVLSIYRPTAEQSGGWSVRRERLLVPQGSLQKPAAGEILDELTTHRLPALPIRDEVWQAGASYLPVPLTDGGRPVYPVAGLVVNETGDEVLQPVLNDDPRLEPAWTVLRAVAAAAIRRGGLPRLIRVGTNEAQSALERLCEFCPRLIIELSKQLDFLHFVMADLQAKMAGATEPEPTASSPGVDTLRSKRSSTRRSKVAPKTVSYQLKVTLRGSRPPIWRRLVVRGDILLSELHHMLQVSMGWFDAHLHDFRNRQNRYGDPKLLEGVIDESETSLRQIAPRKGDRFIYTYDFGDNWEHEVLVEEIDQDNASALSRCLGGRNACPPEDCGGVFGYLNLLESLTDPNHPNHNEAREWVDVDFDPKRFDVATVNNLLMTLS